MRRVDLRQRVKAESGYGDQVVEKVIDIARRNKLIKISVGQHGYTTLRE
jgi:hypothetical protein